MDGIVRLPLEFLGISMGPGKKKPSHSQAPPVAGGGHGNWEGGDWHYLPGALGCRSLLSRFLSDLWSTTPFSPRSGGTLTSSDPTEIPGEHELSSLMVNSCPSTSGSDWLWSQGTSLGIGQIWVDQLCPEGYATVSVCACAWRAVLR